MNHSQIAHRDTYCYQVDVAEHRVKLETTLELVVWGVSVFAAFLIPALLIS